MLLESGEQAKGLGLCLTVLFAVSVCYVTCLFCLSFSCSRFSVWGPAVFIWITPMNRIMWSSWSTLLRRTGLWSSMSKPGKGKQVPSIIISFKIGRKLSAYPKINGDTLLLAPAYEFFFLKKQVTVPEVFFFLISEMMWLNWDEFEGPFQPVILYIWLRGFFLADVLNI